MESILKLENISKSFDGVEVLKGVNLTIEPGEFITILGPSGCGKTTTLRIIAGLEEPSGGEVILEGKNVTHLAPNLRDLNTVFQSYALFPHMNVEENVGYSLKLKKIPKKERKEAVMAALHLVQLEGYEKRLPGQLSGGQSQRVAIARSIISEPKVLLLDEPLGALDLRLRQQMQQELKHLQKQLGITFVYITHDQEEALNMSDRIVVMKDGKFEQIGTPIEVYNRPKTSFVADFIGSANIISGKIVEVNDDIVTFENENGKGRVQLHIDERGRDLPSEPITIAVRGENLRWYCEDDHLGPYLQGKIIEKIFAGGSMKMVVELKDKSIVYSHQHDIACPMEIGEDVEIYWDPEKASIIDWGPLGE